MLRYASLDELSLQNVWLTIGAFDGVHRGHQILLSKLVDETHAAGALAAVLTFHPHPAVVLRGRTEPYYLTGPEERGALIMALGVDEVIVHPFDRSVANITAEAFVSGLRRHLDMRRLFVGPDFALGRDRAGDTQFLSRLGAELDYQLCILEPVEMDGEVISSSRIRAHLRIGDVAFAHRALGRPYTLSGEVVPGDGRGRTIGIPTANLDIPQERLVPQSGVYACRAIVGDRRWEAVTNIGVRPTFTEDQSILPRVETHLLDLRDDLYGKTIELEFIARLRDEQRFTSVAALVEQIQIDIRKARSLLV